MRGSEFAELRAFIEVVEHGNFSRAASALGLAPSTLSQTIRVLEQRLGVRLLQRTTRSVSLTEAGEHLLARIQPAFETLDAAVESINDFRDMPMGTLRLSVSHIPAQMILAPMLKGFLAAYPAINLDISVDNANVDIVKGRYDAGIRHGSMIAQDMVMVKASAPSRMIAVASPEYLAKHAMPESPQDLQHHACVCFRRGNQQMLLWEFEKAHKKIEVGVNGPLIVNEVDLMVKAACDGIGIGYMAETYMSQYIAQGRLIPILTDWSPTYDSWYLYYSSRHHLSAPLKAFIQFLRDSLSKN
ncbi:LysR family transcriptional regulator [Sulfuriferula nivalis]|uniref:LysR family transcriptional regulator n=1 Tax=Sulfuriferula nivalis TaxID=2675298 RepID=A0A809RNM4_9PROT|nr:LysR family transcriptional regulator [Sulfuriferula nivalis]BBP00411.1 LysR family transcriptional regulator [Sulfuriferula nivalis]